MARSKPDYISRDSSGDSASARAQRRAPPAPWVEQLQTPVWIYDTRNYRIHWANARALELWEAATLDELCARDFRPQMSAAIYSTLSAYLEEFEDGHSINRWWQLSPKGHYKNVFCRFSGVRLEDGRMAMLCEGMEESVLDQELYAGNTTMVSMYDVQHQGLLSSNPAFDHCYGTGIRRFSDLFESKQTAEALLQTLREQQLHQTDIELPTPGGKRWHYMELRLKHDDLHPDTLLVMQLDISARKRTEFDQQRLADTDALTGLLNRSALLRELQLRVRQQQPFALLYMDLDGFKLINDTFGHSIGDALLEQVAPRLRSHSGEDHCLARIGGDEFILAVPLEQLREDPQELAARLIDSVSMPYQVAGFGNLNIGASIGIALFPRHTRDLQELIANADTAMYAAKRRGRKRCAIFSADIHNSVRRRTLVVQCLHESLKQDAFELHYQPICDLHTRTVRGLEALLRWRHERLGPVGADEAIAAAEESGLITDLDRQVWKLAFAQLRDLHDSGYTQLRMGVNISGKHILQDDFIEALNRQVHAAGVTPDALVLELTETAMMMDIEGNIDLFQDLKDLGYKLAIDDFGTGYSSLAYLHQLPADVLKIDRSFIARLEKDRHSVRFVRDLARAQDKQIVAEGVETFCQYRLLAELGIGLMQGYLFARPVPAESLPGLLDRRIDLDPEMPPQQD